jgi:DnaB-like helicase C terminal domain
MASDGAPAQQNDDLPVGQDEMQAMVRGLLRHQNLLRDTIRVGMDSSQFHGAGELALRYLFAAMKNLMGIHAGLTKDMLVTELRAWQAAGVMPITSENMDVLQGFIEDAFAAPTLEFSHMQAERKYIEAIIRRFMNTRLIRQQIQSTLRNVEEGPGSLDEKLSRWTKTAQAVKYIGRTVSNSAAMPAFGTAIELPPEPTVTSLPWVDKYIGGFRDGDIIGILGPYSGGKTTLMATAAVRMAQNYYAAGQNKLAVFIGYEDGSAKMSHIFWSAAAHIDRNLFSQGGDFWTKFSTSADPKPYERKLLENRNGKIITGERERWDLAMPWFNKHFVFLDFSENASSGGHGTGGAAEIMTVLTQLAETRNMEIGVVAVDYAGLMVNRELSQDRRTKNLEQIWRPMQMLPDNLRTTVAVPFNCTVLLAHQLAGGDVKKIPSYRYVTHLDAQGSKAFAENLHACLCINTRDPDTRVSTINWSKIRASVPVTPYGLIRMDDHVVDIHLVNDEYVASESSRRIIKKGEDGLVAPDPVMSLKRPRPTGIDTFGADI